MKILRVFRMITLEQLRSPWDLLLTLMLTPCFVFLYWSFYSGGSTVYKILVVDHDLGVCQGFDTSRSCADLAIEHIRQVSYGEGVTMLKVIQMDSRQEAELKLKNRDAAALFIFPQSFSQDLISFIQGPSTAPPVKITLVGDLANPYYSVAVILSSSAIDGFIQGITGQTYPLQWNEEPLGGSALRTEFELYTPGLMVAAGTMMLFSIAVTIARQVESGVIRRLRITRITALDLMGGISLFYLVLSILAFLLTFATAIALGFHSVGPLWLAVLILALTSFSVIGIGLVTASFSGTVGRAAILVNFPLIILLFFSGSFFPNPEVHLFTLGGHRFGLFDFLPHTHAQVALNKVLSLGAGFTDVGFEISAIAVLSIFYFALGVFFFHRQQMTTR
jgi:ABC-2 type transport system permease protein